MLALLTGCRSAQTRSVDQVTDRTEKLRPAMRWPSTWCRVDARLTPPATARYRQIFPKDVEALAASGLPFTWKSTENACEVMPLTRSALATNYQGFLETALCLLAQTHLVRSPFDELKPEEITTRDQQTFLRTGADPDLGIWLDPRAVRVETRTKSRGVLTVDYESNDGAYLPSRMAQRLDKTLIVVDQIEYEPARASERRRPRAFVISVGEEKARPHSEVTINECRPY